MEYELAPGVKFLRLFSSQEEYEAFRERFTKEMQPVLEEQALRLQGACAPSLL